MLIEQVSMNTVDSLRKSNPNPPSRCHRHECKPCLHGMENEECYKTNIGYRIICMRSPCVDSFKTSSKELQTEQFRKQLMNLESGTSPMAIPAVYEGESCRSNYSRSCSIPAVYEGESCRSN